MDQDTAVKKRLLEELIWLQRNPDFEERPASIIEFLGPDYLNIEKWVRDSLAAVLTDLFGDRPNPERIALYQRAIFTGAIGIGKTTLASIVLPYMAHWVMCLKDPQDFFDLMPGTRIAFMQMSTSGPQAKEVVFGDIKARIENSPWFTNKYPYDKTFKNSIRFPQKDIWILPGDSAETTFEGYNILGGILDEIDSHKVTKIKDYAKQGYDTIHGRITSRFHDRGFLLLIGQMKKATGFAAKMYREYRQDPKAYTALLSIWESFGWDRYTDAKGKRISFWYDCARYTFVSPENAALQGNPEHIIEVPEVYRRDFMNSPQKALRDLAGRPPIVAAPFFHDVERVFFARLEWQRMFGEEGPVDAYGKIADWFRARDSIKRVMHVDIAYSGEGDALGIAMGHVPKMVQIDDEYKAFIVIDFLLRVKAPPGREIFLGDIRKIVYDLKFDRKFNLVKLTTDGFQSTDFRQQVQKKRIFTDVLSVDKDMLPYQDLYDAVMEQRIAIPPYVTYLNYGDDDAIDILVKEMSELQEDGNKIDHPPEGSKDLSDALAGVVCTLMGNRTYHSRVRSLDSAPLGVKPTGEPIPVGRGALFTHPAIDTNFSPSAPVPSLGEPTPWKPPRR